MNLSILMMTGILAAALFYFRRELLDVLNNRNGRGPRPPSHPLPADDGRLVRRRRQRQSAD